MSDRCTWCGETVGDAYRVYESAGRAVFCRLEHVVAVGDPRRGVGAG